MKKSLLAIAALIILVLPLCAAEVVVFDKFETLMSYESGVLHVTKNLRIKNVGDNPIIPGEIHFKISRDSGDKKEAPTIENFRVINKYDKELETRQSVTGGEVNLVFTIWDPLLPDFFYDMTMSYDIDFKPSGVLFYQVALPEERTTIPIKNSLTQFTLPKRYHITYAPDAEISSEDSQRVLSWDTKNNFQFEYSMVPLPKFGFRAVNLFYLLIIILFLIHLVYRLRKKSRRV